MWQSQIENEQFEANSVATLLNYFIGSSDLIHDNYLEEGYQDTVSNDKPQQQDS